MALLFLLIATAAIFWGMSQTRALRGAQARLQEYGRRYQPAIDIDRHVQQGEGRVQELLQREREIQSEISSAQQSLTRLNEELALASDAAFLVEVGYYEPRYEFEDLPSYESELQQIREKQKAMLREDGTGNNRAGAAAFITAELTFNNSAAQGRAAQKKTLKLILRAFNGESDSFIARVNYRNVDAMQKRIASAFEAINAITDKYNFCKLNPRYLELRLQELQLVYEYEEAKQQEKEEQARIREQMREEEKAAREAEKAKLQAEKEEAKYQELLQKAEQEVQAASDKDKAKLTAKIEELQQRIAEIEERKQAISQAMLTKTGHVYIISNVGSFGENVYKIGMTRRLEPMDRVKELGDASVPFPFDVHAMIRTSDAPSLENALHKHFTQRRVNLENDRKEFFRVSIDEIRQELDELKDQLGIVSELRLTLLAEAKEYRMSEAKRRHLEATFGN
jgi:chromosome segregation ATPase